MIRQIEMQSNKSIKDQNIDSAMEKEFFKRRTRNTSLNICVVASWNNVYKLTNFLSLQYYMSHLYKYQWDKVFDLFLSMILDTLISFSYCFFICKLLR